MKIQSNVYVYHLDYWHNNQLTMVKWFIEKAIKQSGLLSQICVEQNISYINIHPFSIEDDVLNVIHSFCFAHDPEKYELQKLSNIYFDKYI